MKWWETINTVDLLALTKLMESQGVAWYNVRAAAYQFVTAHQATEITKNILEWLVR